MRRKMGVLTGEEGEAGGGVRNADKVRPGDSARTHTGHTPSAYMDTGRDTTMTCNVRKGPL